MQTKYKIIILGIIAVFALRICLSKEKKKENTLVTKSNETIVISVTPKFPILSKPVNTDIFGVNIGYAFARELDKDSGFVQLLRAMHPTSLRFPGGTVASWYHPNLPVYGYKPNEIIPSLGGLYALQSKRSENILYNFIRLCKSVNTGAVFCANLLNGTVEETIFVIDELKKNHIPILGVELGNEFCLLPYREKIFTSGKAYADSVRATAIAIKKKYPDIKIAVVAGDVVAVNDMNARSKFMRNWNNDLCKENFYDAYTWHFYASCSECDKNEYFDNIYSKNLQELAPTKTNKLFNIFENYTQIYGKEKKLWLTEWNIINGEFLDNTFTQAAFVCENFISIIDINTKHDNYIELTSLHAMDALINIYKGKQTPLLTNKNNSATVQYFAFKFLASTLSNNVFKAEQTIACSNEDVKNNFVCHAFLRKTDKMVFIHYINRSGKNVQLNINANPTSSFEINAIDADFPYATAGKTVYEKEYPKKVKPVRYREEKFTKNTITIAPYSFGYISYCN